MTNNFQQSLSNHVARLTNKGESIAAFLHNAMNDDTGYFQQCHRLRAANILAQHGDPEALTYLRHNETPKTRRPRSNHAPDISEAKLQLAELVRVTTGDGLTIIQHLIDVMQGRNPSVIEGLIPFKPHHRMTAAIELIKLGCCHSTLIPEPPTNGTARRSPLPKGEGQGEGDPSSAHRATGQDSPLPKGEGQGEGDQTPKIAAKWIKRIEEKVASMSKEELNPPLKYEPNYEMWDMIGPLGMIPSPPGQDYAECLDRMNDTIARQKKAIAAKKERQAAERERQRNDNDNHDDG